MSKKVTTKNDLRFAAPPDTKDTIAYRDSINKINLVEPLIHSFGQLEQQVGDEAFYDDNLPEGARAKQKYSRLFSLHNAKGAAISQATAQQENMRAGHLANLAGMTANQMHNYGSVQKTSDPLGAALGIAGAAGSVMGGLGGMGVKKG